MLKQHHPFHMVFNSPWPIMTGMNTFSLLVSSIFLMHSKNLEFLMVIFLLILLSTMQWWRDISRESTLLGYHSNIVVNGLRWGMVLFIISEILFFFSFFWSFFHNSLAPNFEMGMMWPPMGIMAINPFQIPILNTSVLLCSGISVTLSHHYLINNNSNKMFNYMFITILLGTYFTILQMWEYMEASYSFSDSSFGSTFFLATGFHGIHVLVGTFFLTVALMRLKLNMFSYNHHFGMEAAIWYWHFVDVVWLFLYSFLYWWSF